MIFKKRRENKISNNGFPKEKFSVTALDNFARLLTDEPKSEEIKKFSWHYMTQQGEDLTIYPSKVLENKNLLDHFHYLIGQLAIYHSDNVGTTIPYQSLIYMIQENPNTKKTELAQWTSVITELKQLTLLAISFQDLASSEKTDENGFPIFIKLSNIEPVLHHEGKQREFPSAHGED